MRFIGMMFQIIGALVAVGGVVFGVMAAINGQGAGMNLALGGLIGGALLFGIGRAFEVLLDIENNTRRSADALDRIAQARTGVASSLPPDAPQRLQQMSRQQKP